MSLFIGPGRPAGATGLTWIERGQMFGYISRVILKTQKMFRWIEAGTNSVWKVWKQ
jgi:hypothetical protein